MESNRYTLKNYIAISTFNAESSHKIEVRINKRKIFCKEFEKNKEYNLKIEDYFDYKGPGSNSIEVTWNGERECAKKYLKIYKVVVHDQHIAPHSVMITPVQNEYIENLASTEEGRKLYRKKILYPGHEHGWYGLYKFNFLLDKQEIKDKKQQLLISSTGIREKFIHSDATKVHPYRKAVINEDQ
jgi:hypothetical protein